MPMPYAYNQQKRQYRAFPKSLGYPLYVNGREVEPPVVIHHQPEPPPTMEGLGYVPRVKRLPTHEGWLPNAPPGRPVESGILGLGKPYHYDLLRQDYASYPVHSSGKENRARELASQMSPALGALQAVGQASRGELIGISVGAALVGAALYVGLYGGLGWYAGKAMAPNAQVANSYKWAGALSNVFFGGLGLGIVGLVAGSKKR